jgi:hypothetical protein
VLGWAPACDEPHAKKGQGTSADKFPGVFSRGSFKVAVENCRSANDGKREENELNRYDLRGIESLQSSVDVFDLHHCSANENSNQKVEDRKCDGAPERVRQQRSNALGRQSCISA